MDVLGQLRLNTLSKKPGLSTVGMMHHLLTHRGLAPCAAARFGCAHLCTCSLTASVGVQAKKDTPKPQPLPAAESAGRAEVDEVTDEEDDGEYPLDNRFFHLSDNGVPIPSDAAAAASSSAGAPAGAIKKPQPSAATAAPTIDQGKFSVRRQVFALWNGSWP